MDSNNSMFLDRLGNSQEARNMWDRSTVHFDIDSLYDDHFLNAAAEEPYLSEEELPLPSPLNQQVQHREDECSPVPDEHRMGLQYHEQNDVYSHARGFMEMVLNTIRPKKIIRLDMVNSFVVVNNQIFNFLKDAAQNRTTNTHAQNEISCSCENSKCEARYCTCFGKGVACGPSCSCSNCYNIDDRPENGQLMRQDKGCKCERTRCMKRYCECFKSGGKCGPNCRCKDCENIIKKEGIPGI